MDKVTKMCEMKMQKIDAWEHEQTGSASEDPNSKAGLGVEPR